MVGRGERGLFVRRTAAALVLAITACADSPAGNDVPAAPSGTSSPTTEPTPPPLPSPSPSSDLTYLATFHEEAKTGDKTEVVIETGELAFGELAGLPIDALKACNMTDAQLSRAVLLRGRATVKVVSSLPLDVNLHFQSNFEPVVIGGGDEMALGFSDGWVCSDEFHKQLRPQEPVSFDFVLIAHQVLSPNQTTPDSNLLAAWNIDARVLIPGDMLYSKHTITGPYAAQCDSDAGRRRAGLVLLPPYVLRYGGGEKQAKCGVVR